MNRKANYVGLGARLVAGLIDFGLVWLALPVGLFWLESGSITKIVASLVKIAAYWWVPFLIVFGLVQLGLLIKFGGGLGKLALAIKVMKTTGGKLSWQEAIRREWMAKNVSRAILGWGYWWIAKDKLNRAWHDALAGTRVVGQANWSRGVIVLLVIIAANIGVWYVLVNGRQW